MRYWDVIVTPILGRDGASEKLLAISRDISVQRRTEEALREREKRLRLVVEGAKDHAIFTTDPRGVITSWSAGAEQILGWTAADAVGEPAALTFLPEDRVAGVDEVELATAACDGCAPDERWHLRTDGGRVFMNGSVHPLPRDAQGREQGFLKIARDETERRRSDDVLRESEEHYRHAAELNPQVAWTATRRPDRPRGGALAGVDGEQRPRPKPGRGSTPRRSRLHGRCLEPLSRDRCPLRRRASGQDVVRRLSLGALTGLSAPDAAGRIVKWYGATEDLHERKLAEERLRTSEARLSAFLSQASAGIASTDREGRFTFVNDRYCELLGRSQKSLVAGRMQDVTHPDDLAENVPLFMAAVEGGPAFAFEKRYVRPDVTVVWVRNSVTAIRDAHGAFESILAVSVDITDRKAAEAALRESEARFRNVADHAPMMMRVTDPSGACTYLNRLWYEFTGQSEAEALGLGWIKATHPDDERLAADAFLSANAAQVPFRVEYRLRRADGAYRWVIDAASPRFGPSGEFLGYVGSVIDIDERKEIETAPRLRGEEFYALADNIPSLCWIAYANGDIFWYNRRWYEYTGTTPESQAGWGWQSVHDPEVLPAIVARWTYSIDTGEPFEMTFPLKGADGVFRPFLTRIVPIREGHDRPLVRHQCGHQPAAWGRDRARAACRGAHA